jgi:hypothetical protein
MLGRFPWTLFNVQILESKNYWNFFCHWKTGGGEQDN